MEPRPTQEQDTQSLQPQATSQPVQRPQVFGAGQPISPIDHSPGFAATPTTPTPHKKSKKKLVLLSAVGMAVLLLGGGASAYFGYLVPNKPENIWQSAMKNTANGYDTLLQMSKNQSESVDMSGSFKVSGVAATDGTFRMKTDGKNAELTADAGVVASRVSAELRMIDAENSEYPDLYIKLAGLKDAAALIPDAEDMVADYDGKWLSMDHSFFDSLVSASGVQTAATESLSMDEYRQIATAVGEVNREYLFTEDQQKAVLKVVTNVGKEQQDNRDVYHYTVGLDRQHTKDYVTALAAKLDTTPAKKFLKDQTFAQAFDLDAAKKSIDNYKDSDTADVYVDMGTKVVRTVKFTDKANSKNSLELGLHMTDPTKLPFVLKLNAEEDGSTTAMSANVTFDTKANTMNGDVAITDSGAGSDNMSVTFKFQAKPLTGKLTVEKPADATSLNGVLQSLMSGFGSVTEPGSDDMTDYSQCVNATGELTAECAELLGVGQTGI